MRFPGGDVPEADGFIVRPRSDGAVVGRPGQDVYSGEVAGEGFEVREGGAGGVDGYG